MDYSKYRAIAQAVIDNQRDAELVARQKALEREMERRLGEYSKYVEWYDNGPGSEAWKRRAREGLLKEFPDVPGFPFYKEKKDAQPLEDELFEI
jgi:hypothetical protein